MNIVPIQSQAFEPGSNGDFALRYASIGWKLIPIWWIDEDGKCSCGKDCKTPGKHPISNLAPFGQNSASNDAGAIKRWWVQYPKANIAVYLAPSNLCAIDIDPRNGGIETIDLIEAKHGPLASDLLQYTGGGGEHRVFEAPEGTLPGKLGAGVDIKKNGYILLEPSNHASGKLYSWEGSSSPLEGCSASPMPDWLRDMVMVKTGAEFIIDESAPRSQINLDELHEALSAISADDREDWIMVGMALHADVGGQDGFSLWDMWSATSSKYDPTDVIRVWRSFKRKSSGVGKATIFQMAKDRGVIVAPRVADIPVTPPELVGFLANLQAQAELAVVEKVGGDRQVLIPVKNLQALADYYSSLSEEPVPRISMAAALATGCVLAGRRYRSQFANWTSMQMCISAGSGIGKNYAKVGIDRFLNVCNMGHLMTGGFYTHQSAVYWALHEAPNHICISDEFGDSFAEARRSESGGGNKMTVFKAFKQVYSDCDSSFKADVFSLGGVAKKDRDAHKRPHILNPSLTLLGLTTPGQLYREIKSSHIEGGMMNRFVVFNINKEEAVQGGHELGNGFPPEKLAEWAFRMRAPIPGCPVAADTACDAYPNAIPVHFDDDAVALFKNFKTECRAKSEHLEKIGLDNLPNRWRENAMRLATMLAACETPESPIVTAEFAKWCIDLVRQLGEETIEVIKSEVVENAYQKMMSDVTESVRVLSKDGDSLTKGVGFVTMSQLLRRHRSIKSREMHEILAHLVEAGIIICEEVSTGGRPSKGFRIGADPTSFQFLPEEKKSANPWATMQ